VADLYDLGSLSADSYALQLTFLFVPPPPPPFEEEMKPATAVFGCAKKDMKEESDESDEDCPLPIAAWLSKDVHNTEKYDQLLDYACIALCISYEPIFCPNQNMILVDQNMKGIEQVELLLQSALLSPEVSNLGKHLKMYPGLASLLFIMETEGVFPPHTHSALVREWMAAEQLRKDAIDSDESDCDSDESQKKLLRGPAAGAPAMSTWDSVERGMPTWAKALASPEKTPGQDYRRRILQGNGSGQGRVRPGYSFTKWMTKYFHAKVNKKVKDNGKAPGLSSFMFPMYHLYRGPPECNFGMAKAIPQAAFADFVFNAHAEIVLANILPAAARGNPRYLTVTGTPRVVVGLLRKARNALQNISMPQGNLDDGLEERLASDGNRLYEYFKEGMGDEVDYIMSDNLEKLYAIEQDFCEVGIETDCMDESCEDNY